MQRLSWDVVAVTECQNRSHCLTAVAVEDMTRIDGMSRADVHRRTEGGRRRSDVCEVAAEGAELLVVSGP